jgi:hypothetical protein
MLSKGPLHAAVVVHGISEDHRMQLRSLLCRVGDVARAYKAWSQARDFFFLCKTFSRLTQAMMPHDKIKQAELIAGLLLARAGSLFIHRFGCE